MRELWEMPPSKMKGKDQPDEDRTYGPRGSAVRQEVALQRVPGCSSDDDKNTDKSGAGLSKKGHLKSEPCPLACSWMLAWRTEDIGWMK